VQIKNRQQFLTILTLVAVALLAIDKIIAPPLESFWKARQARLNELRQEVKDGESLRRGNTSIRAQWAKMQASTLTNNTTQAEQQLFNGLYKWSQMSGISINNVTPQWKQGSDPTYKTLECRVDATGDIKRLTDFLYDLEKDPMALKLESVEFTSSDNTGTKLGMGVQISGLVLTPKETTATR
jgi:hypothetical protein